MNILKKHVWLLLAVWLPLGFVACSDNNDEPEKPVVKPDEGENGEDEESFTYQDERAYANFFAYNVMNDVYLWKQDITGALNTWQILADPVDAVEEVRYKDASGKDIDRWTEMLESYSDMVGGVDGVSTGTYGFGIKLYLKAEGSDAVVGHITYTYPDSPAEKAGLKRGDVILEVDGKEMNTGNYSDALFASSSLQAGIGRLTEEGYSPVEKTVEMKSVAMYEDPIVCTDVFDCGGKKVGYLAYTSFTFESCLGLYEVCKEFKKKGVSELILDLRYNGGGYVFTEEVLASMLAPEADVKNKEVFQTEIWNDDYMAYFEENGIGLATHFRSEFIEEHGGKTYEFNTADANLNLNKIYAIVDEGSASAAEAILVGLKPYYPGSLEIIGGQTHGKYCAGTILSGKEWYQDVEAQFKAGGSSFAGEMPEFADWEKYIGDWGIYVMVSMYADKNGENPCMPDGLTPDIEAKDLFYEPYRLGDEREAMLNLALQRAGKTDLKSRSASRSAGMKLPSDKEIRTKRNPLDGKRIFIGEKYRRNGKYLLDLQRH